ncbi:MAG: metal-sulfur cluster assembly factor [Muribaculaceae bacterium]|jgi:FeS assembly SUF system protein
MEEDNIKPAAAEQVEERDSVEVEKVEASAEEELKVTEKTIEMLRTVFDPEIPVNVYDLGLIYKIDYDLSDKTLHVDMTLTAPGCPAADFIMEDVRQKLLSVEGPEKVDLRLVFEPVWTQDMMSEEAKLELGFL